MKRFKLLGLALVAIFALAAAMSASAFAAELPETLPTSATTRTWEGAAEGEPEFSSETAEAGVLLVVKCKTAPSEGTEEPGKPLGLFHIHFLGCESTVGGLPAKCTDLNHTTAGEILVLGTWHLVYDRKKAEEFKELTVGILFLVELVHFTCGGVLVEVKGEVLCLVLKPMESNVKHSFHCVRSGDLPTEEWCMADKAGVCEEPLVPKLESNVSHTQFRNSAEQALGNFTYKEAIFADI